MQPFEIRPVRTLLLALFSVVKGSQEIPHIDTIVKAQRHASLSIARDDVVEEGAGVAGGCFPCLGRGVRPAETEVCDMGCTVLQPKREDFALFQVLLVVRVVLKFGIQQSKVGEFVKQM